jgi:hypothetical protein
MWQAQSEANSAGAGKVEPQHASKLGIDIPAATVQVFPRDRVVVCKMFNLG